MTLEPFISADIKNRRFVYPNIAHKSVQKTDPVFVPKLEYLAYEPGKPQGVPLPGSETPGFSPVYRNAYDPDRLASTPHPDISTVKDLFLTAVRNNPDADCLGERRRVLDPNGEKWSDYVFETYAQVSEKGEHLASGILYLLEKHASDRKLIGEEGGQQWTELGEQATICCRVVWAKQQKLRDC